MLAKELKIKTLIRQRQVILEESKNIKVNGNPCVTYIGDIYPENKEYFINLGYTINTYDSIDVILSVGAPINILQPDYDISLTEAEIGQSTIDAESIARFEKMLENMENLGLERDENQFLN